MYSGAGTLTGQGQDAAIAAFIAQHGDTVAGRKVTIVKRDEQGPVPEISHRLAQELVLQDHVDFLVGGSFSSTALAMGDVSTQAKIPLFITGASANDITAKLPYGSRIGFTGSQETAPLARWALKNNIKTTFVMLVDNDGGIEAATTFERVYTAGGGKIAGEVRVPSTNKDFSAYMQRAKEVAPQAVLSVLLNGTGAGPAFVKSFNGSGMAKTGTKLLSTMDLVTEHNLPALGDDALGIISAGNYSAVHNSRENARFLDAYHAAKGPSDPDMLAVSAYDSVAAIYKLVELQQGNLDPDKSLQLIKTLRLQSPRGEIAFDPDTRDIIQTMFIRRVESAATRSSTWNSRRIRWSMLAISNPRAATNPLFNANRMKLGLFAFNGVGNTISNLPPRDASWPTNLRVAQIADAAGLEALVSYARWKGVPRPEPLPFQPHDAFESFTWASALAQATRDIAVLATVHIPMMHPLLVAKMATTVDHVSNGRAGINVVAGWNALEFRMFGTQLKEHDDRYLEGAEWMEILRRLWTEREFDFDGAYYTIERAESFPKPVQQPYPPIMNAGGSPAGRAFAAKYADMCFVMVSGENGLEVAREQIGSYRELARREYGKEIAVWTYTDVILRDSRSEAEAYAHYVDEHRNEAAANAVAATRKSNAHQLTLDSGKTVARTARPLRLLGDAAHINEQLNALSAVGVDGVLLVAQDFEAMIARWADGVLPLMERDGLRAR